MNDLIKRESAIDTVFSMRCRCDTGNIDDYANMLFKALEALPSEQQMIDFESFELVKILLSNIEARLVYEKNQKIGNTRNLQIMHERVKELKTCLFGTVNEFKIDCCVPAECRKAIEDILTPEEFEEFNRDPDIVEV